MTLLTKAAALKWLSWTAAHRSFVFNVSPHLVSLPSLNTTIIITSCIVFCFGVQVFVCMFLRVSIYYNQLLIQNNHCYENQVTMRCSSCNDQTLAPNQPQWNPSIPGANFYLLCTPLVFASKNRKWERPGNKAMQLIYIGKVCFGHSPSYRR